MRHDIRTTPRAEADIDSYVIWVQQLISPASSARWHERLRSKIRTLENHPGRYPLAFEAAELGIELREMLFGRQRQVYRILFTIDGQTVIVHRVRHAAQNWLTSNDI